MRTLLHSIICSICGQIKYIKRPNRLSVYAVFITIMNNYISLPLPKTGNHSKIKHWVYHSPGLHLFQPNVHHHHYPTLICCAITISNREQLYCSIYMDMGNVTHGFAKYVYCVMRKSCWWWSPSFPWEYHFSTVHFTASCQQQEIALRSKAEFDCLALPRTPFISTKCALSSLSHSNKVSSPGM